MPCAEKEGSQSHDQDGDCKIAISTMLILTVSTTGAGAHHSKAAILDLLLCIGGGVQTQGVKGELAHHPRLHKQEWHSVSHVIAAEHALH